MDRRQALKSAFGALALAAGAQNAEAQTAQTSSARVSVGTRAGDATPNYALMSNAVVNSHGLAAGNVWVGSHTGTLRSDDLVRASSLLRVQNDHLEEIGMNAYANKQLSQPPSGMLSPITSNALHAIGERFRSWGILLTDAEIQKQYFSLDPTGLQQGILSANTAGIHGVNTQLADSLDVAAQKLRLLEIAAASGLLMYESPSSALHRALQADVQNQASSTGCQVAGGFLYTLGAIATVGVVVGSLVSCGPFAPLCDAAGTIGGGFALGLIYPGYLQYQNCH